MDGLLEFREELRGRSAEYGVYAVHLVDFIGPRE
jgi:hypothetical protein